MNCHFCGREGKRKNKQGKWLCDTSANRCPVVKEKNSIGLKKAHSEGKIKCGFSDQARIASLKARENIYSSAPFEKQSHERRKKTVIHEQEHKCLHCGISQWMGKDIKLHLDHIDGDNRNNKRENLRALCPNCHSITDTYCGKNINKGSIKVLDDQIIQEIKKDLTNRQILINVGLTPKGGNYERINKLRLQVEIDKMKKI